MTATTTASEAPRTCKAVRGHRADLPPAPAPMPISAQLAARLVITSAIGRYERAKAAFEALDQTIVLGGQYDPALDLYTEILCTELNILYAANS